MDMPNDGFGRRVVMLDKADVAHRDVYAVLKADGGMQFALDWPAGARTAAQVYESIHKAAPVEYAGAKTDDIPQPKAVDTAAADAVIAKVRAGAGKGAAVKA